VVGAEAVVDATAVIEVMTAVIAAAVAADAGSRFLNSLKCF
jgi:hypothetical protein